MKKIAITIFTLFTLSTTAQDICNALNVSTNVLGLNHQRLQSNLDSINITGATSFRWKAFPDSVFAQLDTSNYDFKTWLDSTNMSWESADSTPFVHFNWNVSNHRKKWGLFLFSFFRDGDTCVIPFTLDRVGITWHMNQIPSFNTTTVTPPSTGNPNGNTTGIEDYTNTNKKLVAVYNLMGQIVNPDEVNNQVLIYLYDDRSIEKKYKQTMF
jgi:hypothetical protein